MLSLSSPLWLLALLALPLVWWLHRFAETGSRVQVAAHFLWVGADESGDNGRLAHRPPAIWLLRALFLCLLVLALCGPRWSAERAPALTVWLDDSASMFALEHGETRMQQALAALEGELSAGDFRRITLRSLGAPGQGLLLDGPDWGADLRAFSPQPRGEPQLPAPALMRTDQLHWLVTDGASAGLAEWAGRAPLSRQLPVGINRENTAIIGLALRRNSDGGDGARLSITLRNGGERPATRQLALYAGDELLSSRTVSVDAAGSRVLVLALDQVPAVPLRALISPADALPMDDQLAIPIAALQSVASRLSGNCGPHLRAALDSHPALVTVDGSGADAGLTVHCGPSRPDLQGPVLWVSGGEATLPVQGAPMWHTASARLRQLTLQPAWLATSAGSGAPAPVSATVLLSAGGRPLITHDAGRQLIAVDLDLARPALVRQPEYPLLVAALVERLMGREAAADGITAVRYGGDVVITPQPLPAGNMADTALQVTVFRELSAYLLLAALGVLAVDLLLLLWRQRHARHLTHAAASI